MAKRIVRDGPKAFQDLTGQRFGRLVATRDAGSAKHGQSLWECRCDCGQFKTCNGNNLKRGVTRSCGCLAREMSRARHVQDITGKTFGRLTAVRPTGEKKVRTTLWLCRCECGSDHVASVANLNKGHTRSCGCFKRDTTRKRATTHGRHKSPEWQAWAGMRRRCSNPADAYYAYYGGRGIKVDPRWDSFEPFFADMGERPSSSHELDRIDTDGPYSPGNCRWTTRKQNARNRRNNRVIEIGGVKRTLAEWAERSGLLGSAISARIRAGWTPERAISEPISRSSKPKCTSTDYTITTESQLRAILRLLQSKTGEVEGRRIMNDALRAAGLLTPGLPPA